MDKIQELVRITHEEYRGIVAANVPVSFFSVKFDGKATYVAFSIRRIAFPGNSGETQTALGQES
jgi:hypothetical protein